MEQSDNILDRPEGPARKDELLVFSYVSLAVLAAGVLFRFMHWPYSTILLILGFGGMSVRNTVLFLRKPRPWYAWCYFIGRVTLIAGFILYLLQIVLSAWVFIPAMVFFAGGLLLLVTRESRHDQDPDE